MLEPETSRRRLDQNIREWLRQCRVAVIATTAGNIPWVSTVYYAECGLDLFINTPENTRMLQNMLQNEIVAYAIDEREPTLFLQGQGRALVLTPGALEWQLAADCLRRKVPEASVGKSGFVIVKITSQTIYLSDFRGGYRPRQTLEIDAKEPRT